MISFAMKKDRGVTLPELIAVIGIIAVAAAMAVPNYLAWLPEFRLNGAARALIADLHLARMRAVSEHRTFTVKFYADDDKYTVFRENEPVKTVDIKSMFKGIGYGYMPGKNPSGKKIKRKVTFSGKPPKVSFNPSGMSNKSGSVYLMPLKNTDAKTQRVITVLMTGRVRLYRRTESGWK